MMKKITLLIVSLLLLTGGAMAQPDALPDGARTLKAEGDNLKAVYTQTGGWVINADKPSDEIDLTHGGKVLQCRNVDGLRSIYHDDRATIDVSKMTNLHLDIYPTNVNENGVLGIFVYSKGKPADWRGIEISGIKANEWNSIDIDLSKYPSDPLSPITALAISGGVSDKNENNAGSGFKPHPNETEIYVANAYFYADVDDSKPTLTTSVKNTTSNSITFLAKAVKAKETVGEEITYTVTYTGNNKTFIAQSGVEKDLIIDGLEAETEYNFTIKATDANGISSKEQSQTVKTLKETASDDVTAPTVTLDDINDDDVHVNSVKVSFSGADETSEEVSFDVWVRNVTDNQAEYCRETVRAKNKKKATGYVKGLETGKEYELYVRVRDESGNEGKSEVKRFKTKSYKDNISIESSKVKADNGGIVVLNGKWNVEEFNKIAAEYPYGCFDVRNVVFDDNATINYGSDGIMLFNENAYLITDHINKFARNYAIPDKEGNLIGANFLWYDGDFKPDGGPTSYVKYQNIINDYEKKHGENSYPGVSESGYMKLDPYTGYDIHFENQGISIHRKLNMKTLSGTDGFNIYSTVICPFPMNTSSEDLSHIDFFILNSPSVNGESVMLNFTKVTGKTEPNKPYLVRLNTEASNGKRDIYFVDKVGDRKKELVFSKIANKKEISGQPVEAQGVKATLFGTYVTQTFTTETEPKTSEVYGLKQANDKLTLIRSTNKSTLPAFRAAVKIEELPKKAKNIILSFDGETTGITSINNDEMTSILGNVYSIDGKKVASSRDALVTLPAGIYIVNGKKVVIK